MVKRGVMLDEDNQIYAYIEAPVGQDLPKGYIELPKMPDGAIPDNLIDYQYKDGEFTYNSRKEAAKLEKEAENTLYETTLDLQIRTSALELLTETEA